jgi:HD-GYP domain-containing protein (c-di-GMP phosphodiesterase class II)
MADVYEALTAARPYRQALGEDEALATIRRDVPRRLDADAYAALETVIDLPPAG